MAAVVVVVVSAVVVVVVVASGFDFEVEVFVPSAAAPHLF
jgi:hypothetical protein